MRVAVVLFLLWGLAGPAGAATLSARAPMLWEILPRGQDRWIPLNTTPRSTVEIPARWSNGDMQVWACGPGWFWRDEISVKLAGVSAFTNANLEAQNRIRWGNVGALAALLVIAITVPLATLGARRRAAQAVASRIEEMGSEGWFPADGSLPAQIGPYRVLSRLGSGGMAVVYLVAAPSGETRALKLPLPSLLEDEEFRLRFLREIRLGARLRHPNLVRIEALEGSATHPFMLMEHVEGAPLSAEEDDRVEEAVRIGSVLLEVLEYVHKHGIVHRDLKPQNVMRTPSGSLKLMDFGVARDTVGTRLTSTDEILGTPHYMAPEQLKGGAVDARADLYSLGAILYERLAGELPYPDDLTVTLTMKLTEPMPPLRYLRPDIPPRVEKVLMRMLEMEADHRYPTAREARIALEQAWARDLESARR